MKFFRVLRKKEAFWKFFSPLKTFPSITSFNNSEDRCDVNIYTLQPVERKVTVIFNDSWIHDGSITMIKVIVAWKKVDRKWKLGGSGFIGNWKVGLLIDSREIYLFEQRYCFIVSTFLLHESHSTINLRISW